MTGLACAVLLAVQAQQAQPTVLPPPTRDAVPPSQYEQLVVQYQLGKYDSAVSQAARTPAKAFQGPFERALARLWYNAMRWKASNTPKQWHEAVDRLLRFLLAVRLLHTEAAFRAPIEQMEDQLRLARTADTTIDRAQRDLEPHAETSPYLTKDKLARARHDWVVFIALGYHARSVLDNLPGHLNESFQRYPEDPALELCLGVYDERMARYSVVDESLARDIYPSDHVAAWRHLLEKALTAYELAARAPNLSVEARLRKGRIRAQLNERKRAREDLEPLGASGEPPFIKYLALLLLGEVDEIDKTPDRAAAHYRDALALFPASEAPFIALSRLSDERGDASGARDWLERSFALSTNRRVDPWGVYYAPFIDIGALLVSLREQIRQ
jgi:tetratricopeptide (TPR) repeat protein